jgi:inner membrane protein
VGMLAGRVLTRQSGIRAIKPILICSGLALLPDLDYVGVMLGIADAGPCGHRGATHSLVPPLLIALLAALVAPRFHLPRWRAAAVLGLVVASHALLDAMTESSRGVPLLWPLSFARFEMPWRPIPNAPCGLAYLSMAGLRVASVELMQFLPVVLLTLWPSEGLVKRIWPPKRDRATPISSPRTTRITHEAI